MRSIHRRSFAERGVAFKTNRSEKKKQRRGERGEQEARKTQKAGINEEAKKRNSLHSANYSGEVIKRKTSIANYIQLTEYMNSHFEAL